MIYLLDTDTLIFMTRGLKITAPANAREKSMLETGERILRRCQRVEKDGDIAGLSALTVAELEFGAYHSGNYEREMNAVEKILTPFHRFPFDAVLGPKHYGEVRNQLEASGKTIGNMDLLIAAHALSLGATIVTNNTAHFSRVPDLAHENWSLPRAGR